MPQYRKVKTPGSYNLTVATSHLPNLFMNAGPVPKKNPYIVDVGDVSKAMSQSVNDGDVSMANQYSQDNVDVSKDHSHSLNDEDVLQAILPSVDDDEGLQVNSLEVGQVIPSIVDIPLSQLPTDCSESQSNRPKHYQTKSRKIAKSTLNKEKKKQQFEVAKDSYLRGKFKSIQKCANFYKVPYTTLYNILNNNGEFKGSGRSSCVLKLVEEDLVVSHVKWRASVGCGLSWSGLQKLIQEILVSAKLSNPDRVTGYEKQGHMPNINMVRRLAERNSLKLRSTMEISKGRQVKTEAFILYFYYFSIISILGVFSC